MLFHAALPRAGRGQGQHPRPRAPPSGRTTPHLPCAGRPGSSVVSSPELPSPPPPLPWSPAVEGPGSPAASPRPVPHGPSQGSIVRGGAQAPLGWPARLSARPPAARLHGRPRLVDPRPRHDACARAPTATWCAPASFSRAPPGGGALGHLCPGSPLPRTEAGPRPPQRTQVLKTLAHARSRTHAQTGTHLRAELQALGLFFIGFAHHSSPRPGVHPAA